MQSTSLIFKIYKKPFTKGTLTIVNLTKISIKQFDRISNIFSIFTIKKHELPVIDLII